MALKFGCGYQTSTHSKLDHKAVCDRAENSALQRRQLCAGARGSCRGQGLRCVFLIVKITRAHSPKSQIEKPKEDKDNM